MLIKVMSRQKKQYRKDLSTSESSSSSSDEVEEIWVKKEIEETEDTPIHVEELLNDDQIKRENESEEEKLVTLMKEIFDIVHKQNSEDKLKNLWQKKKELVALKAKTLSSEMKKRAPYFPLGYSEEPYFEVDHIQCHETGNTMYRFAAYSVFDTKTQQRVFSYSYGFLPAIKVEVERIRSQTIRNIVSKIFQFIEKSNFTMYNSKKRIGFWQNVVVQSNSAGDIMVIIGVHDDLESLITEEDLTDLQRDLCNEFKTTTVMKALLLYFMKRSDYRLARWIVFGNDYLPEKIGTFNVRLFGRSKIWANPPELKLMFEELVNMADINKKWGVISIGTLTGVECLYIAQNCGNLIVTQTSAYKTTHIEHMARENGIQNMCFMSGNFVQQIIDGLSQLKDYETICAFMWRFDFQCQYTYHLRENLKVKKILMGTEIKSIETMKNFLILTHDNTNWTEEFVLTKSTTFDLTKFECVTKTVNLLLRLPLLESNISINNTYSYVEVQKIWNTSITDIKLRLKMKRKKNLVEYGPGNTQDNRTKKGLQGPYGPWELVVPGTQVTCVDIDSSSQSSESEHSNNSNDSFRGSRHSHYKDSADRRSYRARSLDRRESSSRRSEHSSHYRYDSSPHSRQVSKDEDRYRSSKKDSERHKKYSDNSKRLEEYSSNGSERKHSQKDYRRSSVTERKSDYGERSSSLRQYSEHFKDKSDYGGERSGSSRQYLEHYKERYSKELRSVKHRKDSDSDRHKTSSSSDNEEVVEHIQRGHRSSHSSDHHRKSHGREHSSSLRPYSEPRRSYSSDSSSDGHSRSRGSHKYGSSHSASRKDVEHYSRLSQSKRR